MIDLVLHFIAGDIQTGELVDTEQHVAAIYDTMEECIAAQHEWPSDIQPMINGISHRLMLDPDVGEVFVIIYCEKESEVGV
ncbi:MAG: hypothetical protein AAFW60_02840 [Pseudomonadota bacterium]